MTCCIFLAGFLALMPGVLRHKSKRSARAITWTLRKDTS